MKSLGINPSEVRFQVEGLIRFVEADVGGCFRTTLHYDSCREVLYGAALLAALDR